MLRSSLPSKKNIVNIWYVEEGSQRLDNVTDVVHHVGNQPALGQYCRPSP